MPFRLAHNGVVGAVLGLLTIQSEENQLDSYEAMDRFLAKYLKHG